jgi:preprotein translocase subunit SecG
MRDVILVIDILAALGVIGLVLLQQGKGADMGAAFGAGGSQTLFGARGSANFLTRATAVLATIFFVANMALAWLASQQTQATSVTTAVEAPVKTDVPAVPAVPATTPEKKTPEVPK